MNVNIDTDIELNIQKVDELVSKLEALEDKSKMLCFLTPEMFSEIRRMQFAVLHTKSIIWSTFQVKIFGKTKVAEISGIKQFYMTKHDKNEEC